MTSAGPGAGTYRYDALGRRIKKTYSYQGQSGTISGNTISIYGPGGELLADYTNENNNISRTDYILYGSQAIARRIVPQSGSATVQDLYRNHLNQVFDLSTYTVTTGLSTMYGIPFGSGGNDQFSGHKDDPESGLHYNLARSFNPVIARWNSPDPIVGNAYDPQSLNKYGYVRNDPVNRVDPDGMVDWAILVELGFAGLLPHDILDEWWRSAMGITTILDYAFSADGNGISGLIGLYHEASVLSALDLYNAMVAQGKDNLAIQNAAEAAVAKCGLDKSCIEQAIREKIEEDGLDASVLGDVTGVTVRGVNGAKYTELIFEAGLVGATAFVYQMCNLGFSNSGRGACPGNAGYTILAGSAHSRYDFSFRDNNAFNGLQVNVSLITGRVSFDIDQGNPAGGLLGLITHGIQVAINRITGRDNTYGCGPGR